MTATLFVISFLLWIIGGLLQCIDSFGRSLSNLESGALNVYLGGGSDYKKDPIRVYERFFQLHWYVYLGALGCFIYAVVRCFT